MADPTLSPIDYNPFARNAEPQLAPVDYNPFAAAPAAPPVAEETPPAKKSYAAADVPLAALTNFLPSLASELKGMAEGVGHAVAHPVDTLGGISKLGLSTSPVVGLIRSVADLVVPHLSPESQEATKALFAELDKPKSALLKDFAETYGGFEEIKRTAAENPARLLMDLATVATGGELALARAPGIVGKIGQVSGKVGAALDPVSAAAAGVKSVVEPVVTSRLGVHSGVGSTPLREAARTGFEGGEAGTNFRRAYNQGVPAEDIVLLARDGVQNMKTKMYDAYKADEAIWKASNAKLGFGAIDKAELDVVNSIMSNTGNSVKFKLADPEVNKINGLLDVVNKWRKDPAAHTVEGLDDLKQALRNEVNFKNDHPQVVRAATMLSDAARDTVMKAADPSYRKAMRDYQKASDAVHTMEQAFSLGRTGEMQTAMSKLQAVMRDGAATQYGLRKQKLGQLKDKGNVDVAPFLAGSSLSSWEPRGLARVGATSLPEMAIGAGLLGPVGAGIGYLGSLAASIPRVVGGAYHNAGRLAGLPEQIGRRVFPAGATNAAIAGATGRPARLGAFQATQPHDEERRASGGFFRGR